LVNIETLTDPAKIIAIAQTMLVWLDKNVLVIGTVLQALVVIIAFFLAWAMSNRISQVLQVDWQSALYRRFGAPVAHVLAPLSLPIAWLVLQWFSVLAARHSQWPHHLIEIAVSLLAAWIVIRLATSLIRNRNWSKFITIAAWVVAALNITALLDPTTEILASMAIQFGALRISILDVLHAGVAIAVLLWLAGMLTGYLERWLASTPNVSPSARVLFGKLFRVAVYTVAVIVGLESVGIDLSTFAVFSGAVGLGVGFGLQKVISNLVSGVILLMDRSVKPGDVIAVGETYGEIKTLGGRYVSVITRDGAEHLIPNEELISQRVENWSYSDRLIRQRLPIGVSYNSDIHRAIELAIAAALSIDRVLANPGPVCQLAGFGDNSVDLELRIWVNDPQNGLGNVRSAVLLKVWDLFRENHIEFPFPQRDVNIKGPVPVRIVNPHDELTGKV